MSQHFISDNVNNQPHQCMLPSTPTKSTIPDDTDVNRFIRQPNKSCLNEEQIVNGRISKTEYLTDDSNTNSDGSCATEDEENNSEDSIDSSISEDSYLPEDLIEDTNEASFTHHCDSSEPGEDFGKDHSTEDNEEGYVGETRKVGADSLISDSEDSETGLPEDVACNLEDSEEDESRITHGSVQNDQRHNIEHQLEISEDVHFENSLHTITECVNNENNDCVGLCNSQLEHVEQSSLFTNKYGFSEKIYNNNADTPSSDTSTSDTSTSDISGGGSSSTKSPSDTSTSDISGDGSSNINSPNDASPSDTSIDASLSTPSPNYTPPRVLRTPDSGDILFDVDSVWDSIKEKDVSETKDVNISSMASETGWHHSGMVDHESLEQETANYDIARSSTSSSQFMIREANQNPAEIQHDRIGNYPNNGCDNDNMTKYHDVNDCDDDSMMTFHEEIGTPPCSSIIYTTNKFSDSKSKLRKSACTYTSSPVLRNSFRYRRLLKRKSATVGGDLTSYMTARGRADLLHLPSCGSGEARLSEEADVKEDFSTADAKVHPSTECDDRVSSTACHFDANAVLVTPRKDCSRTGDSAVVNDVFQCIKSSTPSGASHCDGSTSPSMCSPIPPPPVGCQRTRFSTSDSSGADHSATRLQKITDDKQDAKRERKRARIIEELLYTETTYQRHLDLVVKYFEKPLLQNNILPRDIIAMIFSNIQQLIRINQELMEHLQNLSIGEAFLKLGPFLKLYSTYAKGHERALALLMEWDQKCPEFSEFRRRQEQVNEMNGLKLNALLITPVQRIPRYKLLLEELLSNTPVDHKDYNAIKEAVSQVTAVANHINDHIKQQDNFMKMLAIQKSLCGPSAPKLLVPGRMFIKEGRLKKVSKDGGRFYERMFYLFSDIFMYAKPKLIESGTDHSYTCCCILPLQHCHVSRVFGHSKGQGALFNVKCKQESLLLFSDQDTVNTWITALEDAIREFNNSRQTLRKVSSANQPLRKAAIARLLKHEKQADPITAALRLSQVSRRRSQKVKTVSKRSDLDSPKSAQSKVKVTKRKSQTPKGSAADAHEPVERQSFIEALGCLSTVNRSKRWRSSKYSSSSVLQTPTPVSMETDDKTIEKENETEAISTPHKQQLLDPEDLDTPSTDVLSRSTAVHFSDVWKLDDTAISTSSNPLSVETAINTDNHCLTEINTDNHCLTEINKNHLESAVTELPNTGKIRRHNSPPLRYSDNLTDVLDAATNINRLVCPNSPLVNYGASCMLQ